MREIRVLIADDHQIMIDGVRLMLAAETDIACVAEATDGRRALNALGRVDVDVALVDISMPIINGIELARLIARDYPRVRVVGLSMLQEVSLIKSMLHHGAAGFLPKNAGQQEVVAAIRAVAAGQRHVSKPIADLLLSQLNRRRATRVHAPFPPLSRREKEVLRLILNERTTAEIAEALFVTAGTVESHRRNMLTKLGVRNTAGLVRTCLEHGLLDEA